MCGRVKISLKSSNNVEQSNNIHFRQTDSKFAQGLRSSKLLWKILWTLLSPRKLPLENQMLTVKLKNQWMCWKRIKQDLLQSTFQHLSIQLKRPVMITLFIDVAIFSFNHCELRISIIHATAGHFANSKYKHILHSWLFNKLWSKFYSNLL